MAWTSTYNATFNVLLVRQLLALVQRDQRAALDWVATLYQLGGGGLDAEGKLPSLVSYQLAPLTIPQFPAILIAPMDNAFDREAVGTRHYSSRIYCAIAVAHQDSQVTAELVQAYVIAVDAIFNTFDIAQLYVDQQLAISTPTLGAGGGVFWCQALQQGSVKDLFVASHSYDDIRRVKQQFATAATLELIVDRVEV